MTILAFTPNRPRCGVSDYANHLYADEGCLGGGVRVKRVEPTLWNCLKAPFSGADILHLQHEYSLFGFAGYRGFLLLLYWLLLRLRASKLVITLHTIYDWNRTEQLFAHRTGSRLLLAALRHYGHVFHRLILATASRVVFLSDTSRLVFARIAPPARVGQLITIPIGVYEVPLRAETNERLSGRLHIGPSDYVITLFGFANPNKGFHLAIEALRLLRHEHPDLRLLVVSGEPAEGGNQCLASLKDLAARYDLTSCVVFTGYVPAEDPLFGQVLLRTNCFLYPYLRESATSASLATTLSARKVYITSDLEMFRNFTPGIRFSAGQAADLAAKIVQVRHMNAADLVRYRDQLESYVANNNVPAMRKRYLEAFLGLSK